ncbi:MAG TPA: cytochrome c oxidase subunit II [Gemmataceae bacterium]
MENLVLALGGAGVTQDLSVFSPASPPAASIRRLFYLVLAVTGGIFLLVEVVLVNILLRSRRRSSPSDAEPPQVYGSGPIEIAWTAAPALIVFVLVLAVARTEWEVRVDPGRPPPGSQPLSVRVVGHQWWWEFVYEVYNGRALRFVTANELHVPASAGGVARPVYLTLESADVCHSFWVPRLAGKTDLIPGRANSLWFQTEEPGLYLGQCAEYCGTQHANMLLRVYVDPPGGFERWLTNQEAPAAEDAAAGAGREAFLSRSCVNCHTVRGTPARGTFGPDLTHLMSRRTLGSGVVPNTPEELRRWLRDPHTLKPGCLMPSFGLEEGELDRIADYLLTLH